jgi:arylsulfatase A-like enzyme
MIFFRWFLYVIVASGAMLLMAPHGSAEPIRPNVVIILADDMGYADIGVHGCRDIPTPNIDRIATRGIRFTDAYANGSFCTPTRAALMSGRYQQRIGNEDLDDVTGPFPLAVPTLPERLRAVGYATGLVGKWHLGLIDGYTPLDRGFDEFFGILGGGHHYLPRPPAAPATRRGTYTSPIQRNRTPVEETRYLTTAFGEEAAAFIERREPTEEPFFLYLAFNAVHTPLEATAEYLDRFSDIADPRRRTYAAMQAAMDDAVGLVLRALEKTGAWGLAALRRLTLRGSVCRSATQSRNHRALNTESMPRTAGLRSIFRNRDARSRLPYFPAGRPPLSLTGCSPAKQPNGSR